MTDELLTKVVPTVIVGGLLLKGTELLLDGKKSKKRKSMSLLDTVK